MGSGIDLCRACVPQRPARPRETVPQGPARPHGSDYAGEGRSPAAGAPRTLSGTDRGHGTSVDRHKQGWIRGLIHAGGRDPDDQLAARPADEHAPRYQALNVVATPAWIRRLEPSGRAIYEEDRPSAPSLGRRPSSPPSGSTRVRFTLGQYTSDWPAPCRPSIAPTASSSAGRTAPSKPNQLEWLHQSHTECAR